jgi:hypothetical protein
MFFFFIILISFLGKEIVLKALFVPSKGNNHVFEKKLNFSIKKFP